MIKMILADDEPVITRGIQKLIDWNSIGIEVAGVYENGKDAFSGILKLKPELALLDISMPGKSGVEILKECSELGCPVKIIFISGFQDFEYAKVALKYGAVDYLLKPVIKDELLRAVEKFLVTVGRMEQKAERGEEHRGSDKYGKLFQMEDTSYFPVYAEIFSEKKDEQMQKLLNFSAVSCLEEYFSENNRGIAFLRRERIVIILKGMNCEEAGEELKNIQENIKMKLNHQLGVILGSEVFHMGEIPEEYNKCAEQRQLLFFADELGNPVFHAGEEIYGKEENGSNLEKYKIKLCEEAVLNNRDRFEKVYQSFAKWVCRAAGGKKEDACFYFCSAVCSMQEKMETLGIGSAARELRKLLDVGRCSISFAEMKQKYKEIFLEYMDEVKNTVVSSDKKDFLKAKMYIEQHYMENLTLNILAAEVHMNPYYFSSFFKKNAGENFKEFVNRIRLEHAVDLLVSTDRKIYEIAVNTGFGDARIFSENFQKIYKETPHSYRKRMRGGKD